MTTEYDRLKAQKDAIEATNERKASDRHLSEFCEKVRALWHANKPDEFHDLIACLDDLGRHDSTPKDAEEVAKTILEILEPERVGPIRFHDSSGPTKQL